MIEGIGLQIGVGTVTDGKIDACGLKADRIADFERIEAEGTTGAKINPNIMSAAECQDKENEQQKQQDP